VMAGSARAAETSLDLSTVTCENFFTKSDEKGLLMVFAWLHAYYMDDGAPPIIDFAKIEEKSKLLAEFCKTNPTYGVITAADQVYKK
jgi:acid stress chaperone HdeB